MHAIGSNEPGPERAIGGLISPPGGFSCFVQDVNPSEASPSIRTALDFTRAKTLRTVRGAVIKVRAGPAPCGTPTAVHLRPGMLLADCKTRRRQRARRFGADRLAEEFARHRPPHTWEPGSPVASVNPPYAFALSATHGKTRGTFNDGGQLSFAAEEMRWSGQHGAPSIDAIGHIGRNGKLFSGLDAAGVTAQPGGIGAGGVGANLAIDQFPTELLVNRGVLLDVATLVQGNASPLPANFEITGAHLAQAAQRQGVQLRRGDTVFIRTGWGAHFSRDPKLYAGESSPGPGLDAAEFLIRQGARIVGNDTLTFEKRPPVVTSPSLQHA